VCDGWSWAVLMTDLGTLYSALVQGSTAELTDVERFSEYAIALEEAEAGEEAAETVEYWLQQFAQSVPTLDFPTDRPRPPSRTFASAREDWELPPELIHQLKQLGTSQGCSFMTTLLAGFEVFLHRLIGQEDVIVGVPAAGQAASGRYTMVGHCINLLPLRSHVDSQLSFSAYLKSRKSTVLDAYDHQQFTFGSLLQKLSIARDPSRIPLVPVLFNIDQGLEPEKLSFTDLEVEFFSNPRSYENFEIFINAVELKGKVTLECQYNTNLFDAQTIQRRLAEFQVLLAGIVANPEQTIATLPLLTESEQQLLSQWNDRSSEFPHLCIHQLFEAQAAKTPDAIAVVFENQRLSYRDLDQKANQLAHYLQTLDVGPEVLVGFCCDRSLDMVVGVLGILKAGGAYVPLDPNYPQERLAVMLEDAEISVLLTQSHLAANLPQTQANVVYLDSDWETVHVAETSLPPASGATPDSLAYMIYTSGSTGKPKGVQIVHSAVVNFLTSVVQQLSIAPQDILVAVTTLSFDIAVLELFAPLTIGAQTVIASRTVAADGQLLEKLLEQSQATILQATPATWWMLLDADWKGRAGLKILCGGEALPRALADQLLNRGAALWNLYGPTETTIWSSLYQVHADDQPITVGSSIANTELQVLDKNMQPLPIGIPGELHIGGAGLARGYFKRPELTAEKFVANPLSVNSNAKLYKTGDLARWLPNGQVECLGRIDYQVKVRGFRIELGDIEAALRQHPDINEAIVIVREDSPGEKILVGYFVPPAGRSDDDAAIVTELRQFLKSHLPDFMVPTQFVALDLLPLTPNGKVDRKALPKPDIDQQFAASYVAPTTDLEQQIVEIWTQVFKRERIGIHDNFFEIGGYSLLAIQIVSRLRKEFQIEILLPTFFEVPTVADLARRIEVLRWATAVQTSPADSDTIYEEGEL
jgi:amino acid adenylation domain-containing protein